VGIVIRILVVDDHAIVREGLKQILGDVSGTRRPTARRP
jgi:DNA-binding NarL/FixJ family response regulator